MFDFKQVFAFETIIILGIPGRIYDQIEGDRYLITKVVPTDGRQGVHFYHWNKKYDGLGISELKKLRKLQEENYLRKKLVADLSLDILILQYVLKKVLRPFRKCDMVGYSRIESNISKKNRFFGFILYHNSVILCKGAK
ncbi:MAG: hypothetical protein WBB24_12235 [Maribacter sp.]